MQTRSWISLLQCNTAEFCVVGTMWATMVTDGRDLARKFYEVSCHRRITRGRVALGNSGGASRRYEDKEMDGSGALSKFRFLWRMIEHRFLWSCHLALFVAVRNLLVYCSTPLSGKEERLIMSQVYYYTPSFRVACSTTIHLLLDRSLCYCISKRSEIGDRRCQPFPADVISYQGKAHCNLVKLIEHATEETERLFPTNWSASLQPVIGVVIRIASVLNVLIRIS